MNCSVYIFGELSSGYTQYPEDSSSNVLKTLYRHCKAPTQIAIHRDGSLMLYCYIRKLDDEKYLGVCIAVNGYYLSKTDVLFSLFESTMEKIASQGVLIHFTENGTLTTNIGTLRDEEEELESLTENLRIGFERFRNISKTLPQTDYGIAKDSIKEHCISDGVQDIVRASYSYGFTYIYKDEDYDTVRMNSYKGVLSRLNEENKALKEKNLELQEENRKVLHQKKQYRYVLTLMVLILFCGVGLFFLNDSLKNTQAHLKQANRTISNKNNTIANLNNEVSSLKTCLTDEKDLRKKAENDFASFKSLLNNIQPFIVKKTSFTFDTGWLSFDYYGLREETVDLQVKAFSGNDSYSNSRSMDVKKGNNSFSIYLSDNLNRSVWYSFELLIDKRIVGGDRH
ncbi:MAG: hypothetical protein K2G61_02675 [Bacteroidaceae bacterium]|nr:hypothetical protein [Bacteroidaceae bacterium]